MDSESGGGIKYLAPNGGYKVKFCILHSDKVLSRRFQLVGKLRKIKLVTIIEVTVKFLLSSFSH